MVMWLLLCPLPWPASTMECCLDSCSPICRPCGRYIFETLWNVDFYSSGPSRGLSRLRLFEFKKKDGNCKRSILSSPISTIQFQGLPYGPLMGIPHQLQGHPQGLPQQHSLFQHGLAQHPPHGLLQYLQALQGFAHQPQGMPQQPENSKDE